MSAYVRGFKDGLRDVAQLCETLERKKGVHPAEIAASITAGMIRKTILEKLALADKIEFTASKTRGSA